ncbi:MAG: hypothetical protein ACLFVA_00005 [Dehalococcoidia bacterium]
MARKLPRLKASEVIKILQQHGFTLISQRAVIRNGGMMRRGSK